MSAKRYLLVVLMACIAGLATVSSQSARFDSAAIGQASFSGRTILDASISGLAAMAAANDQAALEAMGQSSAYVLFGTMAKPVVASDEPFEAVVELMEGAWVGTSSLVLNRVHLVFQGEEFRALMDEARGLKAVVIATQPTIVQMQDGSGAMVMLVLSARVIH